MEYDNPFGTYHFSGEGQCSWYEFASEIHRLGRILGLVDRDCEIVPCSSDEYPAAARRPAYSLLSKNKIREVYDFANLLWQDALEEFLQELAVPRASEIQSR
jgi:dTDP-4-dehydrorhamnose reductase